MNNYLVLIFSYLLIFVSLVLTYYRLKKVKLSEEDVVYWDKFENIIKRWKNKFLNLIKISENEIIYLWKNLVEKLLRRIKIFGLKIEIWASKKLENMKNKEAS